jgi:hypothetical protein
MTKYLITALLVSSSANAQDASERARPKTEANIQACVNQVHKLNPHSNLTAFLLNEGTIAISGGTEFDINEFRNCNAEQESAVLNKLKDLYKALKQHGIDKCATDQDLLSHPDIHKDVCGY